MWERSHPSAYSNLSKFTQWKNYSLNLGLWIERSLKQQAQLLQNKSIKAGWVCGRRCSNPRKYSSPLNFGCSFPLVAHRCFAHRCFTHRYLDFHARRCKLMMTGSQHFHPYPFTGKEGHRIWVLSHNAVCDVQCTVHDKTFEFLNFYQTKLTFYSGNSVLQSER